MSGLNEMNETSHRIEGLKLPFNLDQRPCNLENVQACGFYSIDSSGTYLADNSEMKYLHPPYLKTQTLDQPFDLNQDYDKIVPKVNVGSATLTNITKWLRANQNKARDDFICFRGTFSTVMISSLIENKLDWRIGAYLINKTIYLCNFDTELKKEDIKQQFSNPVSVRNSNWGCKFEQFMLSDDPVVKPDGKGELNLNREFCVLYHAKLGNLKLLYGAEVDGILKESKINSEDLSKELENVEFVELKTGKPVGLKMIKWWAQSYFVGIKNLICGEKTENEVKSLKQITVPDILKTVNYKGKQINESNCCNFILGILEFIRNKLFSYEQGKYFLFEWDPRDKFRIHAYITDNPEYKFLTEDFISIMKAQAPSKLNEGDNIQSVSFKRTFDDNNEKRREDETYKKRRQDCDRQDPERHGSQRREYHWDYESERRGNREYHYNTEQKRDGEPNTRYDHRRERDGESNRRYDNRRERDGESNRRYDNRREKDRESNRRYDNRREKDGDVQNERYGERQRQKRRDEEYPVDRRSERDRDSYESGRSRSVQDNKWHSSNVLDY